MRTALRSTSLLALAALTTHALAADRETFSLPDYSPGFATTYSNYTSFTSAGGYNIGRIRLSGSTTEINGTTNDFVGDSAFQLTAPSGVTYSRAVSTVGSYAGTVNFTLDFYIRSVYGINPAGSWGVAFRNSYDDTPVGGTLDNTLSNLSFTFTDEPLGATPPSSTDLGNVGSTGSDYATPDLSFTTSGTGIQWYKFTTGEVGTSNFFDIDTSGGAAPDTEIALFDSNGFLMGADDDDGPAAYSQLSFGQTGTNQLTGAEGTAGKDGVLAAGTYYLAVGLFNSTFADGFTASTSATAANNFSVNFRTNVQAVPEPASMAVLGLGLVAVVRRRRRS